MYIYIWYHRKTKISNQEEGDRMTPAVDSPLLPPAKSEVASCKVHSASCFNCGSFYKASPPTPFRHQETNPQEIGTLTRGHSPNLSRTYLLIHLPTYLLTSLWGADLKPGWTLPLELRSAVGVLGKQDDLTFGR